MANLGFIGFAAGLFAVVWTMSRLMTDRNERT